MFKAIVFDYNGVLADDLKIHEDSYLHVAERLRIDLTRERVRKYIAYSLDRKRSFYFGDVSDERWAEILKLKEGYYFEKATGSDVLFPDVSEVLSSLSSSFALALLTNTPADYFYKVFPSRLSALFAATVFADEVKENKPSPEPLHLLLKRLGMGKDDVCYVGDSLLDVEMAKATGVSIFAVARGANTREELHEAGADYVVGDLREMENILRSAGRAS